MKKRASIYTLGCKVNYCDSEGLRALLEEAGYRVVDFGDEADLCVINTCTVTGYSDHKSRKAIRRARRSSPGALVVATGCYAQRVPDEVGRMEEVDLVVGTGGRENLAQDLASLRPGEKTVIARPHRAGGAFELLPPPGRRGRTRGFLKVQEGCDQACTYCVVPGVRGPLRSLPPGEVLLRAEKLVRGGCREVVLTGTHLGLYGRDLGEITLAALIRELEKVPGLLRIRLSSIEPSDITSGLVELVAGSSRVCPHLHVPLQSGDGEILRLMNRPYEASEYLYLARWLKQEIPGLALSSDVIVGFPGESESHHRRSMDLIREVGFSSLHVFKFASRPGTAAAGYPDPVESGEKEGRSREMIVLGEEMASSYRRRFLGTVQPVLVEKVHPYAYAEGFTPHYLKVRIALDIKGLHWRNSLIPSRLGEECAGHVSAVRVRKKRTGR